MTTIAFSCLCLVVCCAWVSGVMGVEGDGSVRTYSEDSLRIRHQGTPKTTSFEVYLETSSGHPISPWHDLSYRVRDQHGSAIFTFLNEIGRGTREKFEINLRKPSNPIVQDINKEGTLRTFTYGEIPFNYGCIPRTWENPEAAVEEKYFGDGDPIDVVELSPISRSTGQTTEIKVLGALGLLDGGEMDWKIIAIGLDNVELSSRLSDISDVDPVLPGVLDSIRHWFRYYKTSDGKPENQFLRNGEYLDRKQAEHIIEETHEHWKNLVFTSLGDRFSKKLWIPGRTYST